MSDEEKNGNPDYKLPVCWLGKQITTPVVDESGEVKLVPHLIEPAHVNPKCHCFRPMAAHFCMEGHMTECHVGMTCEQANCSHYLRALRQEDGGSYGEEDI